MNSAIRSFRGAATRSVLRVSAIVLVAGLISGPATARADDIVLRWNEIAARTATATTPFNQSRVAAIVQLPVFEAVNFSHMRIATQQVALMILRNPRLPRSAFRT